MYGGTYIRCYLYIRNQNSLIIETRKYFEKVMQDYNQNRNGRRLRKYCKNEAIDYNWIIEYKKNYPLKDKETGRATSECFQWLYPKVVITAERNISDISLWEDAIGNRREIISQPRTYHLCSGCWKVVNWTKWILVSV